MKSNRSVVIIGAGAAGLAAANNAVTHGICPIVLEKYEKPGGIARTETYKGFHFDMGGHRFFTKIEIINRLWYEMLRDNFIKVDRMSRIYYQNRFFNYPLQFSNALANLGVIESTLILLSYCKARLLPSPEEETFEQWVSNRFGHRLYKTFFKTYTEKVWGIPCEKIRSDWAAQRIKGLSLMVAVTNALFNTQKAKSLISEFYYPPKGPGMMWERFQESIEERGGEVSCNTEITGIIHNKGEVTHVRYTKNGNTVILIEHDISFISEFVEWVYLFVGGKRVTFGKIDEILSSEEVVKGIWGI